MYEIVVLILVVVFIMSRNEICLQRMQQLALTQGDVCFALANLYFIGRTVCYFCRAMCNQCELPHHHIIEGQSDLSRAMELLIVSRDQGCMSAKLLFGQMACGDNYSDSIHTTTVMMQFLMTCNVAPDIELATNYVLGEHLQDTQPDAAVCFYRLAAKKGCTDSMVKLFQLKSSVPKKWLCHTCKSVVIATLRCGRCLTTVYCSPQCQKRNWSDHKSTCTVH
jgi:hypothetical protein